MLDIKGGGGLGEAVKADKEEEWGRESNTTIYPLVHPYYPYPPMVPPDDDDDDNDNYNDNDENFGDFVLFLYVTIDQYMMKLLTITIA